MNDDLPTTFTRAADDAVDGAKTADQIRRAAAERIRARRRRRPFFVVGSTVAGLALVGSGAFAAVQLLGDDRAPLPDVIGSPQPAAPPDGTTAPSEPTAEPAESETTVEPTAPTGSEPAQPTALPEADPTAVFPACGAIVDPASGAPELVFFGEGTEAVTTGTVSARLENMGVDDLRVDMSTHLTSVAVKDGVVVGWTEPAPADVETRASVMERYGPGSGTLTADLAHTRCDDPQTPLPAGRYAVWASQPGTVTERTSYDENLVAGTPVSTSDDVVVATDVGSLWVGTDGRPTGNPGLPAGWPASLPEDQAYRGANTEPETVVWIATSTLDWMLDDPALDASRQDLLDLGYTGLDVLFRCQPEAPVALGLSTADDPYATAGSGVAVMFTTRAEADTFVSLWEPLHGPVAGVVTDFVGCDFS